jgi:hypothetical protein
MEDRFTLKASVAEAQPFKLFCPQRGILVVRAPSACVGGGPIAFPCRESLRRFVDQQCELFQKEKGDAICIVPEGMTYVKPTFRQEDKLFRSGP